MKLVKHIANHPQTPMVDLLQPYRDYEARLRQVYAQEPDSELLSSSAPGSARFSGAIYVFRS